MFAGILRRAEREPEIPFERNEPVFVKNKSGELELGWRVVQIDEAHGVVLVDKPEGTAAQRNRAESLGRRLGVEPMEVSLDDLIQWQGEARQAKKMRVVK